VLLKQSRYKGAVQFAYLAIYAEKLPQVTVHEFDAGGHQFNDDLSEVAADIARLKDSQTL
jgi:hypothetical protein